jgi:hypothetical protein
MDRFQNQAVSVEAFKHDLVNSTSTNITLSYPPIMYTVKGRQITDRLWSETLEELGFPVPTTKPAE